MNRFIYCLFLLLTLFVWVDSVQGQSAVGKSSVDTTHIPHSANLADSLQTKRSFLSTAIYENGTKLSMVNIREKFKASPASLQKMRIANVVKPTGPLVIISGLLLGYFGLKGVRATDTVQGIALPGVKEVPDVSVEYTRRSLPKVIGGLGLFVGGICLIELSNELTARSAVIYNKQLKSTKKYSASTAVKLGFTPSGQLGFKFTF